MSKKIRLTNGPITLVDDKVYELIMQNKWYMSSSGYAVRQEKRKNIYMHRVILKAPEGLCVDHRNGDKLDNRKGNIRICTIKQNNSNRVKTPTVTSPRFKGARIKKGRWISFITINGNHKHLGNYSSEEEAAYKYNLAAKKYFGEFAKINDVILPEDIKEKIKQDFKSGIRQFKPRKGSKSGVRGVGSHKSGKWQAKINVEKKPVYLGLYETIQEAELAIKKYRTNGEV